MNPREEVALLREALLDAWTGVPEGTRVTYTPVIGRPDLGTVEAVTTGEPSLLAGDPVIPISGRGLVSLMAIRRGRAPGGR